MDLTPYLPFAQTVTRTIQNMFNRLGMADQILSYILSGGTRGNVWFFVVLDPALITRLEANNEEALLRRLSASLGCPVLLCHQNGLRLAILISGPYPGKLYLGTTPQGI